MATLPYPALTPSATDFTSGGAIYIASAATELPPATAIEDAIRDGRYTQESADIAGYSGVTIAKESSTILDLASAAALSATARSTVPNTDIRSVIFVSIFPFTHPALYNLPAAIAETVRVPCAFATQISNASCAAGIDGLVMAGHRLLLTDDRAALVVAADLWREPHIDRFNCNPNFIFADGAAAVVLSRDGGYARLLSAATLTDPTLSGLHAEVPSDRTPIDVTARARAFFETVMDPDEAHARLNAAFTATVDAALSLAGVGLADVAYALLPAVGRSFLERYLDILDLPISRTTWDYYATTSHIGPGDQFSALTHLIDHDRCAGGDVILLIAEGVGFQFSVAVLQVQ
ncbi:3-oxoacyl-[acyl-carrier-protein] synthase III C-terminal domain-containing protein [Streptomyces sp. NBC_01477]|uniref:3-oxoacyl-[acyl-carrier-protein] synthase III C-terminal domain-containing protein n=1 Tax=Streptomyces sp. NBC_01477 TaxID=2976015 RepID=UPI002E336AAA|nr:3-oxoacyl-[acyl-carrier-protein] synthase III C-terminal domain-containing protein [Streptomyces sp. NBC_01477]